MRIFIILIIFLLIPSFVFAQEFGLVLNQNAEAGKINNSDFNFEYNAQIVPRMIFLLGDNADFFVSAGLLLGYSDAEDFTFVPELLRTEFSFFTNGGEIKIGRFGYSAPLPFLINGLFDGVQVMHRSTAGRFKIGGFYTGFLYKNNALISMTEYDRSVNEHPFEYSDFTGTYFAPPRIIASIDWEHFSIADTLQLNISAIAQFDLTKAEQKYDSQYLTIKAGLPAGSFVFEIGGIISAKSYAGEIGVYYTMPTPFNSRLSINARHASEKFIPISTIYMGEIYKEKLAALTVFELNYLARFTEKLGANISAKYFINEDEKSKGTEIFGKFTWSPVSDLQFNLGGGAFIPLFVNDEQSTKPVWLVKLAAVFVLY